MWPIVVKICFKNRVSSTVFRVLVTAMPLLIGIPIINLIVMDAYAENVEPKIALPLPNKQIEPSVSMTSVNTLGTKWTTFSPSIDTRIIYVSDSTGNDSICKAYAANQIDNPFNPGASFIPCKTISTAAAKYNNLPNNEPHWILFKSGDIWTNQNFGKWQKSGRSITEPALLASYGDSSERPKVLTGASSFSGAVSDGVRYVTLADLYIHAHTYVYSGSRGPRAFRWIMGKPGGNWVFEGLHVQGFQTAFLVGSSQPRYIGKIINIIFRNNIINGNQGENALYISGINGLKLFEGNTFYDNAYWHNHADGSYRGKHLYFDNENGYPANGDPTGQAVFRNNFFIASAAIAFQARTGGEIANNYVESHGMGIVIGKHDRGQSWPIVTASVHDNVIMHMVDSLHQTLGYGIVIENSDINIERNIIAYYGSSKPYGHPFYITGKAGNIAQTRLLNNTIYNTAGNIRIDGDIAPIVQTNNLINDDMDILATNIRSSTVNFVDADLRDLAKYNRDILGGSRDRDAFMNEALKQWRGNFRIEYTAIAVNSYIQKGFKPDSSQVIICGKGAVLCGEGVKVSTTKIKSLPSRSLSF